MAGTLYIVATPIGNLEDITLRAIRTLSEVDEILAEDTRVTQKLLTFINSKLQITNSDHPSTDNTDSNTHSSRLQSYHQHTGEGKRLEILKSLMDGKNIALITDAGTPGISDPGNELIDYLLSFMPDLKVVSVPGPSALVSALSVSGFDASKFIFLGFWPRKKVSKTLTLIKQTKLNVVFYESPYRLMRTLSTLEKELGGELRVSISRELTKMYESQYRGKIRDVRELLSNETIKGEIVVIVEYY